MAWGWIIICFIFFWPLGLFFLLRKLTADRSATLTNSGTISTISYVLIALCIMYLFLALTGNADMLVAAFLLGFGGFWVYRLGQRTKTTGERYTRYIVLIVNQGQTSIDTIALAIGVSYEDAVNDLQKMIDTGYFANAYIDVSRREIVLAQTAAQQAATQPNPQYAAATPTQTATVVTCRSCGANNRVTTGQPAECEYCGSLLS
jgi:hypothetical protein